VKGLAWVELDTADEDWKTEAAIAVRRPDMLRIDVMDSLADVWAKIGSDGRDVWLYVPGKRKLYKGRASSRNMRRLTSFDSEPGDLVSLITGMPPLPANAELVQIGGLGGSPLRRSHKRRPRLDREGAQAQDNEVRALYGGRSDGLRDRLLRLPQERRHRLPLCDRRLVS
jgi:hypothetical protein